MNGTDNISRVFDVVVIGGGPAGMLAAGRAAELGAAVALVEKNARLGAKLLMTGGGRCNLTNTSMEARGLAGIFGRPGRFLYPSVAAFGPEEVMRFFGQRGLGLKTEDGGRVFPVTDSARDVRRVLNEYMRGCGVAVMTARSVTGFETAGGGIIAVRTGAGLIHGKKFIVCTGGMSYPATGSTGEGFGFMRALGHTVTPPAPALAPVKVTDGWVRDVEGAGLSDVMVSAYQGGKRHASARGSVIFTKDGISGPAVLDISGAVGGLMAGGAVSLSIDIVPGTDFDGLDREVQAAFAEHPNRLAKNCIDGYVPPRLAPAIIALSGIDPEGRVNRMPREQRRALVGLLKGLTLGVSGLYGFKRAMVTAGGVSLNEVDPKTMRSKVVGNLFVAGEVLDITGPTGGYNLQICWSTGYAAGSAAATSP